MRARELTPEHVGHLARVTVAPGVTIEAPLRSLSAGHEVTTHTPTETIHAEVIRRAGDVSIDVTFEHLTQLASSGGMRRTYQPIIFDVDPDAAVVILD